MVFGKDGKVCAAFGSGGDEGGGFLEVGFRVERLLEQGNDLA